MSIFSCMVNYLNIWLTCTLIYLEILTYTYIWQVSNLIQCNNNTIPEGFLRPRGCHWISLQHGWSQNVRGIWKHSKTCVSLDISISYTVHLMEISISSHINITIPSHNIILEIIRISLASTPYIQCCVN